MYFASKYAFVSRDDEYEYVSDEEYDQGLSVSDDEDDDVLTPTTPPPPPPPPTHSAQSSRFGSGLRNFFSKKKSKTRTHHWKEADPGNISQQDNKRRFKRADTNVVSIRLNTLKDPSNMHAGDAVKCESSGCHAVMSHISQVTAGVSGRVWECEFCGTCNEVDVEDGEIPKDHDVTYLLQAAPATEMAGPSGIDESIVVFCIDISGSMCVSTEVEGKIKLRSRTVKDDATSLNPYGEDQYLPGQKRNVTYISRLHSMQAAVDKQLEDMAKEFPNRRVAIISFNSEIKIMDEGVNTDQIITGKKLEDEDDLIRLGSEISSPKPIKETQQSLANKVFQLEEGGQTALGPALVVALGLASRCAGSKIIVCTDGVANVGLGRLDGGTDEEREKFYNDMGDKAAEKGVSISVIAIKGADSKLLYLGKLADRTNGQVNHVDPLKLTEEFGNILADRIIATNVTATMILQKSMKFSDKDTDGNVFVENIGNATMDTEITFHYEKRGEEHTNNTASGRTASTSTESDAKKEGDTVPVQEEIDPRSSSSKCTPNPSALEPCELPFQLQLEYTDTYGTKALRVLTEKQPVTKNRKKAEESVDVEVIGVHTARTVAEYGLKGEYTKAREVALMNQRLAWRHTRASAPAERKKAYKKMFNNIQVADRHVTHAQLSERTRYGKSYSDSEEDDEVDFSESKGAKKECCAVPVSDGPSASAPPKSKARKKKAKRSEEVTDDMANDFYGYKNANFSKLLQ